MERVLSPNATLQQILAVAKILKTDMANRPGSLRTQRDTLNADIMAMNQAGAAPGGAGGAGGGAGGLARGQEVNGYVYQGGDPNAAASWKKK